MSSQNTAANQARGDGAYKVWVAHTAGCGTCRAGAVCGTAVRLGRAWREARR